MRRGSSKCKRKNGKEKRNVEARNIRIKEVAMQKDNMIWNTGTKEKEWTIKTGGKKYERKEN